jgi:hypothetical protein
MLIAIIIIGIISVISIGLSLITICVMVEVINRVWRVK